MEQQDKPVIPTLKDSQKPQVKIKGLATTGLSLIERLKAFKKKDLAFIMAGLGVLFMAPLAEHFMMAPEGGESGAFKEGWGLRPDGAGGFGKGGSPYESGVNGLAPGGLAGGGSDVITPLNVRDPSALVMGPGGTQQPPTSAPPPAPPKEEKENWKDALANAAAKGASAAVKKASLPVPRVPLTNAGLRGLGAVSGGSGAQMSLSAPSAGSVPNTAAQHSSLSNVKSATGYRGAAGARGASNASAGSFEALKKAAAGAGGDMNRSGPASTALDQAASRNMNVGTTEGAGGEGQGAADKAAAQSQDKGAKSTGESLEFLRQKAEQDKAIDLKWKLKEKQAMRWPNLQDKMLEEAIMTPLKGITGGIAEAIKGFGKGKSASTLNCLNVKTGKGASVPAASVGDGLGDCDKPDKDSEAKKWYFSGDQILSCADNSPMFEKCDSGGGKGKDDKPRPKGKEQSDRELKEDQDAQKEAAEQAARTGDICKATAAPPAAAKAKTAENADAKKVREGLYASAQQFSVAQDALTGQEAAMDSCGARGQRLRSGSELDVDKRVRDIRKSLNDSASAMEGVLAGAAGAVSGAAGPVNSYSEDILTSLGSAPDDSDYNKEIQPDRTAIAGLDQKGQDFDTSLDGAKKAFDPLDGAKGPLEKVGDNLETASALQQEAGKAVGKAKDGLPGEDDAKKTGWGDMRKRLGDDVDGLQRTNDKQRGRLQSYLQAYKEAKTAVSRNGAVRKALGQTDFAINGQSNYQEGSPRTALRGNNGLTAQTKTILGVIDTQIGAGKLHSPVKPSNAEVAKADADASDARSAANATPADPPGPKQAAEQIASNLEGMAKALDQNRKGELAIVDGVKQKFVGLAGDQGSGRTIYQTVNDLATPANKVVEHVRTLTSD